MYEYNYYPSGTKAQTRIRRRITSEHEALTDTIEQLNTLLLDKYKLELDLVKTGDPDTLNRLHKFAGTAAAISELDVWEEVCEEAFILQDEFNRTEEGLVVKTCPA